MTICVANCLHWIGFHIVNRLLEDGYQVDGIADNNSEREEELSLMLGRNSSFTLYNNENQLKDKSYTDMILVGNKQRTMMQSKKIFTIGKNIKQKTGSINIELPLLFGEWMPMDEHGVYLDDHYVKFDSRRFKDKAIYIDDFIDCFMQWIKVPNLPTSLSLTRDKNGEKENSSDIQMYLSQSQSIDEQISKVTRHYQKIKYFGR